MWRTRAKDDADATTKLEALLFIDDELAPSTHVCFETSLRTMLVEPVQENDNAVFCWLQGRCVGATVRRANTMCFEAINARQTKARLTNNCCLVITQTTKDVNHFRCTVELISSFQTALPYRLQHPKFSPSSLYSKSQKKMLRYLVIYSFRQLSLPLPNKMEYGWRSVETGFLVRKLSRDSDRALKGGVIFSDAAKQVL